MRILKTLNLPMDRTVRMVLWGGEEEGLLGSRAYIKKHFGNLESMKLTPGHAKVSAYYNFDNGTGRIRGVYLQENDMIRPIFDSWLRPFRDLGATTLASRRTGGSDHLSFDMIGIPGFQFIQDPHRVLRPLLALEHRPLRTHPARRSHAGPRPSSPRSSTTPPTVPSSCRANLSPAPGPRRCAERTRRWNQFRTGLTD